MEPSKHENNETEASSDGNASLNYSDWNGIDEMVSLCMSCGENGVTRLMLHKIPHFRELILASFHCEACGERNNEVTFGGEIQEQGCVIKLDVTNSKDMDRQLIKSDSASVRIPELDFEIPAGTQKGEITTIEGLLRKAANNLSLYQEERMAQTPETGQVVARIISSLTLMAMGEKLPFTIILDDPAGNSYIENPSAPAKDPCMKHHYYKRTPEQDISLGLQPEAETGVFRDDTDSNFKSLITGTRGFGEAPASSETNIGTHAGKGADTATADSDDVRLGRSEAISIPSPCPHCGKMGESLTALTDIPHFKEIIIMAFDCSFCGFRNNEVKAGGAVPDKGTEVTLKVLSSADMQRDLLKSDSCMVKIPELELELGCGTLGGVYTTVEGLLNKIHTSLQDDNPFAVGDSSALHHSEDTEVTTRKSKFESFLDRLKAFARGEVIPFTLVLRDPLGNSFVSAPLGSFLPPESDPNITLTDFERTYEENDDFGLNDINTRDFETGVDHLYQEPILSDRITHPWTKGPDHPTFYAKGTDDNTPGGVAMTTTSAGNPTASEEEGSSLTNQQQITKAEPEIPDFNNRTFSEKDMSLDYIPYEEFSGAKEGYVFRMGAKGLGYYQDIRMTAE